MLPLAVPIGTPYGARSRLWSCNRNAAGEGIHTGVDFPATVGTRVHAARPGVAVYADHGSAFGFHQLEIRCDDGTRDFYAHMTTRLVTNGARVDGGDLVGRVGAEGNVTGPHLHFERHKVATGIWSCSIITNPQPSLDWQEPDMPLNDADLKKIRAIVKAEATAAVADVLDVPMNAVAGAKGEDQFETMTLRAAIKALVRSITTTRKN